MIGNFLNKFKSNKNESPSPAKNIPAVAQSGGFTPPDMQQTAGNKELARRVGEEELADPYYTSDELQTVYETNFFQPLKNEVAYKFGVGRRAFRRSKELNAFRQKMKDEARLQASNDITNHIQSGQSKIGDSEISKEFYSLMANREAYAASKLSVNSIMQKKSEEIINRLLPEDTAINQLDQAAVAAVSVNQAANKETRKKKALSSAQAKAVELLERYKEPAINEARKIVKGDKSQSDSKPDEQQTQSMLTEVRTQVTSDDIGKNALDKVVEAESVNSGLNKISPLIQAAVPNEGDSASVNFELKIPVGKGAFVLIGLGAEAENDGDHFKISANISIGAGVGVSIAELSVSLGMFIEANGSNITSTMNLLSYGMYRNTNAAIPPLARKLWGMDNKSGRSSLDEAEIWASAIEANELTDEENYVDVGQSLTGAAAIETGIYSGQFELAGQRFTKYNKKNIDALAQRYLKDMATGKIENMTEEDFENTSEDEKERIASLLFGDKTVTTSGALSQKAELLNKLGTYKKISVSTSHELTTPLCDFSFSADGAITFYDGHIDSLEASFSVDIPGEIAGVDAWGTLIEDIIPTFLSLNAKLQKLLGEQTEATPEQQQAAIEKAQEEELQDKLEEKVDELTSLLSESTKSIDPETGEAEYIVEKDSGYSLNLELEKEFEDGKASDWKIEFDVSKSSSMSINAGFLTIEFEKTSKLMSAARQKKDGKKKNEVNFY